MAAQIDRIDYGGTTYEFVDQTARNGNISLSTKLDKYNDAQTVAITEEIQRAVDAEKALEISKVTREAGKGLSTNDFTDDYKEKLDTPPVMVGATDNTEGKSGVVPAPIKGKQDLYLDGSGNWSKPTDTTYEEATRSVAGLLSAEDKTKLDGMDAVADELSADHIVFNSDGSISETLSNGKTKKTVFNSDGSITQTIVNKAGIRTVLKTTFNNDGSIDRKVT